MIKAAEMGIDNALQYIIEETQTLLLSDSNGIYIPKMAVEEFEIDYSKCWNDSAEICKDPDHDQYWDNATLSFQ